MGVNFVHFLVITFVFQILKVIWVLKLCGNELGCFEFKSGIKYKSEYDNQDAVPNEVQTRYFSHFNPLPVS